MEPQYWRIKRKNGEGHGNWDYMSWVIFGQKKGLGFRVYCEWMFCDLRFGSSVAKGFGAYGSGFRVGV